MIRCGGSDAEILYSRHCVFLVRRGKHPAALALLTVDRQYRVMFIANTLDLILQQTLVSDVHVNGKALSDW